MTRHFVPYALPLLFCLVAACDRGEPARNMAASEPGAVTVDQAPKGPPEGNRSIMRPSVVPEAEPAPPPPKPLHAVVAFGYSTTRLDDAARSQLDALAKVPQVMAGGAIILRGSTDSRGSDERNRTVSARRARMVADYLAGQGVARDRMTIVALGEDRPIAPNANLDGSDDPQGRSRNRRVDITVQPAAPDPAEAPAAPATDQVKQPASPEAGGPSQHP